MKVESMLCGREKRFFYRLIVLEPSMIFQQACRNSLDEVVASMKLEVCFVSVLCLSHICAEGHVTIDKVKVFRWDEGEEWDDRSPRLHMDLKHPSGAEGDGEYDCDLRNTQPLMRLMYSPVGVVILWPFKRIFIFTTYQIRPVQACFPCTP